MDPFGEKLLILAAVFQAGVTALSCFSGSPRYLLLNVAGEYVLRRRPRSGDYFFNGALPGLYRVFIVSSWSRSVGFPLDIDFSRRSFFVDVEKVYRSRPLRDEVSLPFMPIINVVMLFYSWMPILYSKCFTDRLTSPKFDYRPD